VVRQLGEGGMGQVFEGSGKGESVAIKLMRRELATRDEHRRRFRREVAAAAAAESAHVVAIVDSGEWEGIPYLVQPLIRGGSLKDRLDREGSLELSEAVRVCAEVGSGLSELHRSGLIHRDVKPANVLISDANVFMVSDFGLVKDPGASVLTTHGRTLGSPHYMAPEQIRGEEVVPATDVYSLACVSFECLTGRSPFADTSGLQTLWSHLRAEAPDACGIDETIPEGVGWALTKAMAKEPGDRPATPHLLTQMLRTALES